MPFPSLDTLGSDDTGGGVVSALLIGTFSILGLLTCKYFKLVLHFALFLDSHSKWETCVVATGTTQHACMATCMYVHSQ